MVRTTSVQWPGPLGADLPRKPSCSPSLRKTLRFIFSWHRGVEAYAGYSWYLSLLPLGAKSYHPQLLMRTSLRCRSFGILSPWYPRYVVSSSFELKELTWRANLSASEVPCFWNRGGRIVRWITHLVPNWSMELIEIIGNFMREMRHTRNFSLSFHRELECC